MLTLPLAPDVPQCVTNQSGLTELVFNVTHSKAVACSSDILVGKPVTVVIILLVAVVVRQLTNRVIARAVSRSAAGRALQLSNMLHRGGRREVEIDPLLLARKQQRAETIGSVLRSTVGLLILFIVVVEVLGVVGINLGPIIASAGIVGVALGFGAQNLVKDFLAGVFILLEDQYGVGDVIDLGQGQASGVVEDVGLRVTRLRSVDGGVWYVRNGEILAVGNLSQNWSRALLDVRVAYGSDLDQAMDVIKATADQLTSEPDYADAILAPPEMWGVQDLDPDQVTLRLVIKTVPLQQWRIGRELRRRLKADLAEAGIEIPYPQRTVWLRTEGQQPAALSGTVAHDRDVAADGTGDHAGEDHSADSGPHSTTADPVLDPTKADPGH